MKVLNWLWNNQPFDIEDGLFALALASIAIGAYLITPSAAFIAAGILLLFRIHPLRKFF